MKLLTLTGLALVVALAGCTTKTIEKRDFTGDGWPDSMQVYRNSDGKVIDTDLFIAQGDSINPNYLKVSTIRGSSENYLKGPDGITYFFDGHIYRQAFPPQ